MQLQNMTTSKERLQKSLVEKIEDMTEALDVLKDENEML
jgi:hypothetical protein